MRPDELVPAIRKILDDPTLAWSRPDLREKALDALDALDSAISALAVADGQRASEEGEMSAQAMVERYAEPFTEPDGRTTWAVREYVYEPDRYFRQIVSWHETRAEAEAAIKDWRS